MNAQLQVFPVDTVGFDLRHVMGDIINLKDMMIGNPAGQNLLETAADMKCQHLTVGKCIIGGRLHG